MTRSIDHSSWERLTFAEEVVQTYDRRNTFGLCKDGNP